MGEKKTKKEKKKKKTKEKKDIVLKINNGFIGNESK
jgi:hypothetical protein